MAKIVRPLDGRARVWLPFRSGSGNYDLLRGICGERTRPEYNPSLKCFEVARDHVAALVELLPGELGQPVEVELHGSTQTKCVEACWTAKPETVFDCVCSCAGRYHGSQTGPPKDLGGGLAVETEYTTHVFTAYPRSW